MTLHAFLTQYLQFFLFPLSQIGYRLSTRKKDKKEWAFLLQLFTQAVWIVWALSIDQGWATLGSFAYAGQYIWNYLEHKHPRFTDPVNAAVSKAATRAGNAVRTLLPKRNKGNRVVQHRAWPGLRRVRPGGPVPAAAPRQGEGGLPVRF